MNLTYNEIIERDGEKVGLAYERLVTAHLENSGVEEAERDLMAQDHTTAKGEYLCRRAKRHADQETITANAYKQKQALCQRCHAKVQFDWCQDMFWFQKEKDSLYTPGITTVGTIGELEVESHSCPFCEKLVAFSYTDDAGAYFASPELTDIDWELECNRFECHHLDHEGPDANDILGAPK